MIFFHMYVIVMCTHLILRGQNCFNIIMTYEHLHMYDYVIEFNIFILWKIVGSFCFFVTLWSYYFLLNFFSIIKFLKWNDFGTFKAQKWEKRRKNHQIYIFGFQCSHEYRNLIFFLVLHIRIIIRFG
jgi:hypothetical protein